MTDGFEKLADKEEKDFKRRKKLNDKDSSIKPELIDKTEFFADRKRGDCIADNVKETPNVETDPNQ